MRELKSATDVFGLILDVEGDLDNYEVINSVAKLLLSGDFLTVQTAAMFLVKFCGEEGIRILHCCLEHGNACHIDIIDDVLTLSRLNPKVEKVCIDTTTSKIVNDEMTIKVLSLEESDSKEQREPITKCHHGIAVGIECKICD